MSLTDLVPGATIESQVLDDNFGGLSEGTNDALNNSMATFRSEISLNFAYTGLVWSISAGLNGTMTAGVAYVGGVRVAPSSIASRAFTASRDTYVDVNTAGVISYVEVANGATTGMTLTSNSIRIAKVVTSGAAITSVTTSGWDPIGNAIYNRDPYSRTLNYAQITASITGLTSASAVQLTGLSCPVIVKATGRRVEVELFIPDTTNSSSAQHNVSLWLGTVGSGTQIAQANAKNRTAGDLTGFMVCKAQLTATLGLNTFNAGIAVSTGSGNVIAASTNPAFLTVKEL